MKRRPRTTTHAWRCLRWGVPDDVSAADVARLYRADLVAALQARTAAARNRQGKEAA